MLGGFTVQSFSFTTAPQSLITKTDKYGCRGGPRLGGFRVGLSGFTARVTTGGPSGRGCPGLRAGSPPVDPLGEDVQGPEGTLGTRPSVSVERVLTHRPLGIRDHNSSPSQRDPGRSLTSSSGKNEGTLHKRRVEEMDVLPSCQTGSRQSFTTHRRRR